MQNLLVTVGQHSIEGTDGGTLLTTDNAFCGNTGNVIIENATLPVAVACVMPLIGFLVQVQKAAGGDMMLNEIRIDVDSGL